MKFIVVDEMIKKQRKKDRMCRAVSNAFGVDGVGICLRSTSEEHRKKLIMDPDGLQRLKRTYFVFLKKTINNNTKY